MLRIDASLQALLGRSTPDQEAAALQHVLTGESVIDWRRLHCTTPEEVDALLRLNRLDFAEPADRRYAGRVHGEAVRFVEEVLGHRLAEEVRSPADLREVFLLAAGAAGPLRSDACTALKVMNVVQHVNARELRLRMPLSDGDLYFAADWLMYDAFTALRGRGVSVERFEGGLKSRDSLLLKLMTPAYRMADEVPDRLRYRLVVESRRDVIGALRVLMRELLPFNVVVPGQSRNDLVPLDAAPVRSPEGEPAPVNPFSGPQFRVLSFVVDLPIRGTDFFEPASDLVEAWGPVLFATLELQIVDAETALTNEHGENSHERYKDRQRRRVLERLAPDLVRPDDDTL